jgi:hypothetical protein
MYHFSEVIFLNVNIALQFKTTTTTTTKQQQHKK